MTKICSDPNRTAAIEAYNRLKDAALNSQVTTSAVIAGALSTVNEGTMATLPRLKTIEIIEIKV